MREDEEKTKLGGGWEAFVRCLKNDVSEIEIIFCLNDLMVPRENGIKYYSADEIYKLMEHLNNNKIHMLRNMFYSVISYGGSITDFLKFNQYDKKFLLEDIDKKLREKSQILLNKTDNIITFLSSWRSEDLEIIWQPSALSIVNLGDENMIEYLKSLIEILRLDQRYISDKEKLNAPKKFNQDSFINYLVKFNDKLNVLNNIFLASKIIDQVGKLKDKIDIRKKDENLANYKDSLILLINEIIKSIRIEVKHLDEMIKEVEYERTSKPNDYEDESQVKTAISNSALYGPVSGERSQTFKDKQEKNGHISISDSTANILTVLENKRLDDKEANIGTKKLEKNHSQLLLRILQRASNDLENMIIEPLPISLNPISSETLIRDSADTKCTIM